ncbi:MAG TPA: transglycosylase SLT domain-containing protein [Terriglobales bacterium]|nr:transglycosylase SLT domain-containing protein [Terriglobales bacterium]
MRKHLISVLFPVLYLIALQPAANAQGIVATRDSDGRVIYENAPPPSETHAARPDSGMVYWSNTEHSWKPVPAMNSNSMRAAQSAAAEVRRLIRQAARKDPKLSSHGGELMLSSSQLQNPVTTPEPKPNLSALVSRQAGARARPHSRSSRYAAEMQSAAPPTAEREWIDSIVEQAALRHEVDPNLVRAIVRVESNFNPHAVSRKGAIGLMQLMPYTARSLNVSNPFDPRQNVDAGVRHFKKLLDSYGGNLELSLAAYNAGSSAVQRSGGVPRYAETQNYVKKITELYGSNTARLFSSNHPIIFKRDAEGHLSASDID